MVNKWIFPLNRKLEIDECQKIENEIINQLSSWNTHGKQISFHIQILHSQIILIEALIPTSGCSVDTLQNEVREVLKSNNLELLPNHYVFYLKNYDELGYFDFRDTSNLIKNQLINLNTEIIDNQKILEGDDNHLSVLRDTWLVRYC